MMGDNQQFCSNCGTRSLAASTAGAPDRPPPPPVYPPPPRSSGVIVVVIVLVVVVAIGLVAAAALFLANPGIDMSGEVSIDSADVDDRPVDAEPEPGNRIINIVLTMTNHGSSEVPLEPSNFELEVAGGGIYPPTDKVDTTMPDALPPGGTETFNLAFEVPESAEPTTVRYTGPA